MSIQVLNPTHEGDFKSFKAAEGLKSLKGAKLGIISNGKKGTFHFFNALEELLIKNHGVKKVIRVVKKNYSALLRNRYEIQNLLYPFKQSVYGCETSTCRNDNFDTVIICLIWI